MYTVGQEEIDAVTNVIRTGALFRYGVGHECDRFEERYANYLGIKHFALAASGSNALVAAMIGLGLGPGDEVLIPAHTYMATATSVLTIGAIPVIVDIDETLTIDPKAVEAAIQPWRDDARYQWEPAKPSLEDVFIHTLATSVGDKR